MAGLESTALKKQITIRKQDSGIAFLIMDTPGKVNLLTAQAMDEFEEALIAVSRDADIKALCIVSGKSDSFIAGADLHEIIKFEDSSQSLALARRGQTILTRLSHLKQPTVAAIHGICLGGGLEVALACDRRIASTDESTLMGLPECKLGFVPGLGGTQRLPRLIGAKAAVQMIISAEPVSSEKAKELALVDQIVPVHELHEAAVSMAASLIETGKPAAINMVEQEMTEDKLKSFFALAERSVRLKTKGRYPAQVKALEVMKFGLHQGLDAGLNAEAEAFAELSVTDVSRNLVFLFFTTEFVKSSAMAQFEKSAGGKLGTVGIVGGGMMGTAIARIASLNGLRVIVKTVNEDRQQLVIDKIKDSMRHSDTDPAQRGDVLAARSWADLAEADIIVEACAEDESVKAKVLQQICKVARSGAVIASNTSSLPINKLSQHVTDKESFLGMHFFYPVDRMPLVEVVASVDTRRDAISRASGLICKLGKVPVSVKDSPSFLVNRLVSSHLTEAATMPLYGFPLNWIEEAALDFGMPMGPFSLADEIGLDVTYNCALSLEKDFGPRMSPPTVLTKIVQLGVTGKKSNSGFFLYSDSGKKLGWDPRLFDFGCCVNDDKPTQADKDEIAQYLIFPMIDEAARCLEEKVIRRPREIDLCVVLGLGFPPFRGGLLRYADSVGVSEIIQKLERIYDRLDCKPKVSSYLKKLASEGRGFYTRGAGED